MKNKITSAILALVAFFVFALVCHERYYKTGNWAYQVAIGVALIGVMVRLTHGQKNHRQ